MGLLSSNKKFFFSLSGPPKVDHISSSEKQLLYIRGGKKMRTVFVNVVYYTLS